MGRAFAWPMILPWTWVPPHQSSCGFLSHSAPTQYNVGCLNGFGSDSDTVGFARLCPIPSSASSATTKSLKEVLTWQWAFK